jgi:hypothetical protein
MFSLNSVKRIFRAFLPSRRTGASPQGVPHYFVVSIPARLLLSITFNDDSTAYSGKKLIASTQSISESGLIAIVATLSAGTRSLSEGDELQVTLDLHPLGLVEMNCLVVRLNDVTEDEELSYLLGLKITMMRPNDRALYIEYLGTHGWEKVLAGNGRS